MNGQDHIGDGPFEEDMREELLDLARFLDKVLNGAAEPKVRTVGFCLLVFHFGDPGRCNYVSNTQRDDVIRLLREQLAKFEATLLAEREGKN